MFHRLMNQAAPVAGTARRRRGRIALVAAAVLVLLTLAAAVGVAWYYSNLILVLGGPSTLREQRVLAAGPGWVRLSRDRESLEPGTWALEWPSGYGWVGLMRSSDDSSVVREYRPTAGELPVGDWASLRGVAKAATPRSLLGLSFEDVTYEGPLGRYPAWLVPGLDTTWAIAVHGRGASRAEALRTLSAIARRGLPTLIIGYRNDAGAPRSADGFSHLGETEWADLEAAVRYALDHGARRVVLFGYSMGGQVVMQFLSHSPLAPRATAAVLESPMLDWNRGLAHRSRIMGAPAIATPLAEAMASLRGGLDWKQLDRVANTGPFSTPVLIFHGDHDRYAPLAVSEEFARAHPGNVTLVPYTGANHVEAWNVGPERYRGTLNAWLTAHGVGGRD